MDHYEWYDSMFWYSHRKLSNSLDKLPAISALAEVFALLTNDTYLAGWWRTDLTNGLLWHSHQVWPSVIYRAPSWSWAAYDGLVDWTCKYRSKETESYCKIIDAQVTVNEESLYSHAITAYLRISGPLAKVKLERALEPFFDHPFAVLCSNRILAYGQLHNPSLEDIVDNPDATDIWAFLVARAGHYKHELCPTGLLLRRKTQSESGESEYLRIGHFIAPASVDMMVYNS